MFISHTRNELNRDSKSERVQVRPGVDKPTTSFSSRDTYILLFASDGDRSIKKQGHKIESGSSFVWLKLIVRHTGRRRRPVPTRRTARILDPERYSVEWSIIDDGKLSQLSHH